ncbi:MAG: deoxynucleotide monophosphate kinase family protein [Acidimicrobiales bacterium]
MRIYVAGPMRGLPDYNFSAFDAARDFLAGLGHDVVSPADIDRLAGFVVERGGRVALTPSFSIEGALRRDFAAICSCDAVAFLPGWEASSGSLAERRIALDVGCQLWRVDPGAGTFEREVVVGLSGYARAGKDTVAQILVQRHGFVTGAFADALKLVLAKLDPIICDDIRLSDIAGGMEEAKALPEVRCLLQRLGTEAGRNVLGADVWVRSLLDRPPVRLAVSDCRFVDEAEAVRARGGLVVRVDRPGFGPVNGHVSETALDGYDFDAVLVNDGSIEDLSAKVEAIVPALGGCQSTARRLAGAA